jgi:nitroreductase
VDFANLVGRRRMVRRYTHAPVDGEVLERVLSTALRAPSAGFAQGQHLVVVTAVETRRDIAAICREPAFVAAGLQPWLSVAPVHVVVCVAPEDYRRRYAEPDKATSRGPAGWDVPFWFVDGGATLLLLLLAAADEGLGAGFLDIADAGAIRDLLGIPGDVIPVGLVTLGHAATEQPAGSAARGRRPTDEVLHREHWDGAASGTALR